MEGAESEGRIGVCGDKEAAEVEGVAASPRLPSCGSEWRQPTGLTAVRGFGSGTSLRVRGLPSPRRSPCRSAGTG